MNRLGLYSATVAESLDRTARRLFDCVRRLAVIALADHVYLGVGTLATGSRAGPGVGGLNRPGDRYQ